MSQTIKQTNPKEEADAETNPKRKQLKNYTKKYTNTQVNKTWVNPKCCLSKERYSVFINPLTHLHPFLPTGRD